MSGHPAPAGSVEEPTAHAPVPGLVKAAPAPATGSAPPAEHGWRVFGSLKSAGNRLFHEVREVCTATWAQSTRFARYGKALRNWRSLARAFSEAQLALGQRMYAAGIDDGETGAKIRALDERILRAGACRASSKLLGSERAELVLQLAACALGESAPLPGADAEYDRARDAQAALENQSAVLASLRASLLEPVAWVRAGVGYGTVGCFFFFGLVRILAGWPR